MQEDRKKPFGEVAQFDEQQIQDHLGELVQSAVEETLNAKSHVPYGARRYEFSPAHRYLVGSHERTMHTSLGGVEFDANLWVDWIRQVVVLRVRHTEVRATDDGFMQVAVSPAHRGLDDAV